jgi:hypothetical protein
MPAADGVGTMSRWIEADPGPDQTFLRHMQPPKRTLVVTRREPHPSAIDNVQAAVQVLFRKGRQWSIAVTSTYFGLVANRTVVVAWDRQIWA